MAFVIDAEVLCRFAESNLGKTILVSNRMEWSDEPIIEAYRSQYLIEAVFKEIKDRITGSWWPLNHWTDSELRVHGLYCSMAQLLRSVMWRRVRQAGVKIPLKRLLSELDGIRELRVHGLYCSMAKLLRSVMWRRVRQAGVKIPLKRLLSELDGIREVINLYPKQRKSISQPQQTVLTKMSQVQQRLASVLDLEREKHHELG